MREDENEEWLDPVSRRRHKNKSKLNAGTAEVDNFMDLAGPADYWIGNTNPTTTPDAIKTVLTKCAEALGIENFSVKEVKCLTKDINPRSKSWKVSVPNCFRETMTNPAMFCRGWTHRVFTHRPSRKADSGGQAGGQAGG